MEKVYYIHVEFKFEGLLKISGKKKTKKESRRVIVNESWAGLSTQTKENYVKAIIEKHFMVSDYNFSKKTLTDILCFEEGEPREGIAADGQIFEWSGVDYRK